jgi:probable F420-dependent oxidoreductase
MRIGVVIPTFDQFAQGEIFARICRTLEALGYDSAWFGDHVVMPQSAPDYMDPLWLDALTCAIHGLGLTSRLAFGTDVLVAPYRDPRLLAKMAASAALLAGGRLQLGLGIGWLEDEFKVLGSPPFTKRARVTEEYIEVIRLLFETEGETSYHGEFVSFDGAMFAPRPVLPLPILLGGNNANALRRAAIYGDGWHPLFMKEPEYAACRAEIERTRAEQGIARPFVFSYSAPQGKVTDEAPPCREFGGKGAEGTSYAPAAPADEHGRLRFTGTAEQWREDCRAFAAAGVDQLVIRFAVPRDQFCDVDGYFDQLHRFAEGVLPVCGKL